MGQMANSLALWPHPYFAAPPAGARAQGRLVRVQGGGQKTQGPKDPGTQGPKDPRTQRPKEARTQRRKDPRAQGAKHTGPKDTKEKRSTLPREARTGPRATNSTRQMVS